MNKMKKVLTLFTTGFMVMSSFPIPSANAKALEKPDYALGDVDMDGVITGHDSAIVSYYLNVDEKTLTEDQLVLADYNADGTIDQSDLDLIHERETFAIGDVFGFGHMKTITAACMALRCYAEASAGNSVTIVEEEIPELFSYEVTSYSWNKGIIKVNGEEITQDKACYQNLYSVLGYTMRQVDTISVLNSHLLDVNGDGNITIEDAYQLLVAYSVQRAGGE